MLGPHRQFEVHTRFSYRDRENDAHKFSTNLRHYPYAKALARLLGESCQHNFYFDAFSGPLKFIKEWLSYGDYPALSLILTAIVDSHEDFEHLWFCSFFKVIFLAIKCSYYFLLQSSFEELFFQVLTLQHLISHHNLKFSGLILIIGNGGWGGILVLKTALPFRYPCDFPMSLGARSKMTTHLCPNLHVIILNKSNDIENKYLFF